MWPVARVGPSDLLVSCEFKGRTGTFAPEKGSEEPFSGIIPICSLGPASFGSVLTAHTSERKGGRQGQGFDDAHAESGA